MVGGIERVRWESWLRRCQGSDGKMVLKEVRGVRGTEQRRGVRTGNRKASGYTP